jgi:hypothetical protein
VFQFGGSSQAKLQFQPDTSSVGVRNYRFVRFQPREHRGSNQNDLAALTSMSPLNANLTFHWTVVKSMPSIISVYPTSVPSLVSFYPISVPFHHVSICDMEICNQASTAIFVRLTGVQENVSTSLLQDIALLALDMIHPEVRAPAVSVTVDDIGLAGSPVYNLAFMMPDLSHSRMQASNISLKLKNKFVDLAVPLIFTDPPPAPLVLRRIIDVSTTSGSSSGGTLVVLTLR